MWAKKMFQLKQKFSNIFPNAFPEEIEELKET